MRKKKKFYSDWQQASLAAQKLGIINCSDYKDRYKVDSRLPSSPYNIYKAVWESHGRWYGFLGTQKSSRYYPNFQQTSEAAQKLGIENIKDYKARHKVDPRLPAQPSRIYKAEWISHGRWLGLLGKKWRACFYSNWQQASEAAQKLGITNSKDYKARYKADPRLPACPENLYKAVWESHGRWFGFLGTQKSSRYYPNFQQASEAAQKLSIANIKDYKARYKVDPRLPCSPNKTYKKEWASRGRWLGLLGKKSRVSFYSNWQQASEAVQKLSITSLKDYKARYKVDPHLPACPDRIYKAEWNGRGQWPGFLGKKSRASFYSNWQQASEAAQKLGILDLKDYKSRYKTDPLLPWNPSIKYKEEWISRGGMSGFLIPKKCNNIDELKQCVRILDIKNSKEYRDSYKFYTQLPAHPDRKFRGEWIDWYDLLDIPKPYSYQKALALIQKRELKSIAEYKQFISVSNDLHFPRNPDQVYAKDWINWYVFLGNDEPFRTQYIHKPYTLWARSITAFLKLARGGNTKQSHLCRFVQQYIKKHELGNSPSEFLTSGKVEYRLYRIFLDNLASDGVRKGVIFGVNQFLDYILRADLTLEDEDTGELTTFLGAKNPFATLNFGSEIEYTKPNETTKPALAFQYVKQARLWMIPPSAKTFSDLKHLHRFDADWFYVDPCVIDKTDPDCVFKTELGKTKLWFPVYWMHTYSLVSVPARGRQIAYNDSGEADEQVPEIQNGKIDWVDNDSIFACAGKNEGFIKQYPDGQIGMHFTTNKTSKNLNGYDVPWMPSDLAYWLIRLRKWQKKYNPITRPMPWIECERTFLNEKQLRSRGANCFLFRDYGEREPGSFSSRLIQRLAATLYHSQPGDIELAKHKGAINVLSHYSSEYTPHSMRVSLITAYVMEFGLPIEVIMKVVGHASIVMTLYYCKVKSEELRHRFTEGEKKAWKNKAYAAQRMIEQKRVDDLKQELVSNSEEALQALTNKIPVGNFLFRDYGICPVAGSSCSDGGDFMSSKQIRAPTPYGYLGTQNCLRCRHFITGPAFLGGLLSLINEISLQANHQSEQYSDLESQSCVIADKIEVLDEAEYDAIKTNKSFDSFKKSVLQVQLRKIEAEVESAAKKLDMLVCDFQAAARLIKQCHALINQTQIQGENKDKGKFQLVANKDHELHLSIDKTSYFRQLCEVCENAEIYESASGSLAISPRSQLLDKMAMLNNIQPRFFSLTQKQQLIIGNQLVNLLLARLKTWENVDALMDGRIHLKDLSDDERITRCDVESLFKPQIANNLKASS